MNEFTRSGAFYKSESYRYWICDVDLLKERQIEEWHHFDLSIIDRAINEGRKRLRRCIRENGGHFQHQL